MNFVQKLIADTEKGDWDFYWKHNEGSNVYTLNKAKHYLTGLNFSVTSDYNHIIFPNGYKVETDLLSFLEDAVWESIERTVSEMIKMYLAGKELTPDQEEAQAEQEKNKSVEPKTKVVEKTTKK